MHLGGFAGTVHAFESDKETWLLHGSHESKFHCSGVRRGATLNCMSEPCQHLDQIKIKRTSKNGCEDCLKTGDSWVHLRLCLTCGYVGCCDSSKNKHATKHFHKVKHPLVRSIEPGESWVWCYIDEVMLGELES
jgi:uncharacterized UBP type Zn finger protein